MLRLEADVADPREQPQVGLGLLERERDPCGARMHEGQAQLRMDLHVAVERERREQRRRVHERRDRLRDPVADLQVRGDALDERAGARPFGIRAARRRVHAGRDVARLERGPDGVVRGMVRVAAVLEDRTDERGPEAALRHALELAHGEARCLHRQHGDG